MAAQPNILISVEDYLKLERDSPIKNEFYKGQLIPVSGISLNHNIIVANMAFLLKSLLEERFYVFGSDMRLGVPNWESYFYPDLVVAEEPLEVTVDDNLTNPTIIVEVLSKSTQDKDRGLKFALYRQIPSLKEYIMVSSELIHVERFTKMENGEWVGSETKGLEHDISIPTYGVKLSLNKVYKGTTFIVH